MGTVSLSPKSGVTDAPYCGGNRQLQPLTARGCQRRGFMEDTGGVVFCSDTRTEKMEQVQANPAAEACWYFEDSREQFRLSGELVVAGPDCTDSRLVEVCAQCK